MKQTFSLNNHAQSKAPRMNAPLTSIITWNGVMERSFRHMEIFQLRHSVKLCIVFISSYLYSLYQLVHYQYFMSWIRIWNFTSLFISLRFTCENKKT